MTETYTDSAGNELTEAQVWDVADVTARQMDRSEMWSMLKLEWMSAGTIPRHMTRCPCHGLWYDKCEVYA